MSSYSKPQPQLDINHIRRLLFSFSAFIILCSIKTIQLVSKQPPKQTRARWPVEETDQMLDLLIHNKAQMDQAFSFPQSVYAEVAKQLGLDKNGTMVGLKWQSLKKTWRAITAYNRRSGCSFHATYGADVQSQAEQEAWDAFMACDSPESREMSQSRNKGWPFYEKMVELCPGGSGATGAYTFAPSESMSIDQSTGTADDDFDDLYPDSPMPETMCPELNLDDLLQLGLNIASPNPAIQSSAFEDALSMLSQVMPNSRLYNRTQSTSDASTFTPSLGSSSDTPYFTFPSSSDIASVPSPGLHLATSRTTSVSSKVSKGKSKGRTPTRSSLSSSVAASRQSKATQAQPSVVPALVGLTGALLRAMDIMYEVKDLLMSPPTASPPKAPISNPTSPETFFDSVTCHASKILMADVELDLAIRSELAFAFLRDKSLSNVYRPN